MTTLKVVEKAKHVHINQEAIESLAAKWNRQGLPVTCWNSRMHLETADGGRMLDYLIILDSLNFCFWHSRKPRWWIWHDEKKFNGYFALSIVLKRFFEKSPGRANLRYLANIPFNEFATVLQGGKNLLYIRKRWEITQAVSRHILKRYRNSKNFVLSADQKLNLLVPKIATELPSFNDVAKYRGEKVFLWKRAQILAMDIQGAFAGQGIGTFNDLDYPTAFPDYKLPQILAHYGILEYSPELKVKIESRINIPAGSEEEVEIRSATVWAVEWLKDTLVKYGGSYRSFKLDWVLWEQSQKEDMKIPYHLTHTIFY